MWSGAEWATEQARILIQGQNNQCMRQEIKANLHGWNWTTYIPFFIACTYLLPPCHDCITWLPSWCTIATSWYSIATSWYSIAMSWYIITIMMGHRHIMIFHHHHDGTSPHHDPILLQYPCIPLAYHWSIIILNISMVATHSLSLINDWYSYHWWFPCFRDHCCQWSMMWWLSLFVYVWSISISSCLCFVYVDL